MTLLARLSLRARLLLALIAVSLLLFFGGGAVLLQAARQIAQDMLDRTAHREAKLLRASLVEPLVLRDYTSAEQLLRREVEAGDAQYAELSVGTIRLVGSESPAIPQRPDWFAHLLGLYAGHAEVSVIVGGRD